ncbi:glycosyl hydrolase family 61-domain-containing protein, partial [Delphinella strobiligena]
MNGVARVCSVNGGSTMTFEYREWANDASKGSIDISHKGPCAAYLKKVDSAETDTATGSGWFKIWDEGYDETAGKWCTEKLIDNDGHLSITIPDTLQSGYYLARSELLALHQADKNPSNPQFYIGCAQIFLHSSGSSLPSDADLVSIPGYVEAGQPSVSFNIWKEPMALPYPIPGPVVFNASSNGVTRVADTSLEQTEGLQPSDCVLVNANWCGIELSKYTTQNGCWNASTVCWSQCKDCYDTAPPTGSTNCKIWEAKCQTIDDQCNAGNFAGPPDYMMNLTPALQVTNSLPAAVTAQVGDGSYLAAMSNDAASSTVTLSSSSQGSITVTTTATAGLASSTDGSCGNGVTCAGSTFGNCCSAAGYCGSSDAYCNAGCNAAYGKCDSSISTRDTTFNMTVSINGHCGRGVTCLSSPFGSCCSSKSTCGSDMDACGFNCQPLWGKCFTGINRRNEEITLGETTELAIDSVSSDGSCGNGVTCLNSAFGNCCGPNSYCGSDIDACGFNCQPSWGTCFAGVNRRSATSFVEKRDVGNDQEAVTSEETPAVNPRWTDIQSHANWVQKYRQRRVRKTISQHMREVAMM